MLANRLRIAADPEKVSAGILNTAKAGAPDFWRGSEWRVEFALFDCEALDSISSIASVVCRVKDSQTGSVLLMEKTLFADDLNGSLTLEQWQEESAQHGAFVFSGAESNLVMDRASLDAWLVIVATLTDGEPLVLAAGKITCHEANFASSDTPPEYPPAVVHQGPQGDKGWSPILGITADGARRVLKVNDWTGGAGVKPDSGKYIGTSGLVDDAADAVDLVGVAFNGITGMRYDGQGNLIITTTDGDKFVPLNDIT